ncbi:unnamed protein product [Arabis nemorensis]|uniref:Uncharacterized protein n=1 Tax=Arabis nemorensis TaxID=586526 RepID=A0A565C4U7_9BRAS|nr:unnamed protein product [Arabis nemorensis]
MEIENIGSEHLQEVRIQYLEENNRVTVPHGSPPLQSEALLPRDQDPWSKPTSLIRSLEIEPLEVEDRVPASQRLGPKGNKRGGKTGPSSAKRKSGPPKTTNKKKNPKAPARNRVAQSPLQGVSLRKRNITRGRNSPRKRLCLGTEVALPLHEGLSNPDQDSAPAIVMIPAITCKTPHLTSLLSMGLLKKGVFCLDRRLLEKEEVRELIVTTWNHSLRESNLTKINRCRRPIIQWTKEQNANSLKLIKVTQEALEKAFSDAVPDTLLIGTIMAELEKHYRDEELFWKQRSRIQWFKNGDRNSGYIHAATRGKRARKTVIEDSNGNVAYDEG